MASGGGRAVQAGRGHAQRPEHRLVQVVGERHPRRGGHRLAEQLEPLVGVDPSRARLGLGLALLERDARGVRGEVPDRGALRDRPASSQSTAPSSTAISTAYATIGLVTEASRNSRSCSPATAATVPSARTTAAAAWGTGQSSTVPDGRAQVGVAHEPSSLSLVGHVRVGAASNGEFASSLTCHIVAEGGILSRWRVQNRSENASDLDRHVGLALPAVARRVLPAGPAAAPRARAPGRPDEQRRDQRLVLLAAAARVLPRLGRGDPRRLPVRRQGQPLHHPPQAAARRPRAAGQLPRLGRPRARPQARPAAVAAPAAAALRRRRGSTRSCTCCRAAPARRRSWPASTTRGSTGGRRRRWTPTGRCGTRWRSATRASGTRRSSRCCARTTSRSSWPTPPGRSRISRT